jgi:catechol 2,3-dioxygenase-like lactoylglutathione lyase family enzyme
MDSLSGRTVFFVKEAERALAYYTETLGFTLDWNHKEQDRAFVFQVSLFGFQLILNQIEEWTQTRAGQGRVFIGLESDQVAALRRHIVEKNIQATIFHWGQPTLVLRDLDQNELFFWLPPDEWASMEAALGAGSTAGDSANGGLTSQPA